MIRVLVKDDDPKVRYGIYDYLKRDYEVYITKKENEVFNILNQTNIHLIICNYFTLKVDMEQFIKNINSINDRTLILVISDKLSDIDKREVLRSKIDDYMEKPLDLNELSFRIEHLLKVQFSQYQRLIEIDNLKINCDTKTVIYKNIKLDFFDKEFQILYHLLSYPNKIFTKRELVDLVCDTNENINEDTIRTYVSLLRKKINFMSEIEILTIKGIGYKGIIKK